MYKTNTFIPVVGAVFMLFSLVSCSEEIDLISKDTVPIIYCLLDPSDSVQKIRVSKSFNTYNIDSTFSNDSMLISDDLELFLVHERPDNTQEYFECFLSDEFERRPGLFPRSGLSLYIANCRIEDNHQYSLILYRETEQAISYGKITSLGGELEIIDPRHVPHRFINLFPGQDYYVRFSNVKNAFIYQVTLVFEYDEIINGIPKRQFLELPQEFTFSINGEESFLEQRISGAQFLKEIERNIQINPNATRIPVCFNFWISCCGEEVYLKVKSEVNANNFSVIDFTNLGNARGIFSTINHKIVENLALSIGTIDSIALNSGTKELNFLTHNEIITK